MGEARVAERRQTLQRGSEHPAKAIVEQGFGVRQRPLRVEILAALLPVSLVEAAEASREIFGTAAASGARQMTLAAEETDPDPDPENILTDPPLCRPSHQRHILTTPTH